MSKQELDKIEVEVQLQEGESHADALESERLINHAAENNREIIEEAGDSKISDFHDENHEKFQSEEPVALEGDKKEIDNLQPTADSSLNQNEYTAQQNPTDSQNEIQNTATEEDGETIESIQKQEESHEIVEQTSNQENVDNNVDGDDKNADVETNDAAFITEENSNLRENKAIEEPKEEPIKEQEPIKEPEQKKEPEPYEMPILDERQQELVKNMSAEDKDKYLRTMAMIQKSKNETQKVCIHLPKRINNFVIIIIDAR